MGIVGVAIFVILRKRKQQRNSFYNSESPESTILLHTVSSISNSDPLEENDPNLLITLEANSTVPDNDSSNNYASNTNSDNSKNNNNHIQDTNEAPEKLYLYEDMADTEPVTNSDCNGTSSSSPIYDYATPYAKQVLSHPSIEKDILIDGVIGNGSFGVVKLGRIHNSCVPFYCRDLILKDGKNNYLPCAVKLLKDGSDEKAKRDFSDECKMMANFYHPNVIRVVAVLLDSNPAMLVTEFMKYGDLKRALIISEKKSVLWNEKELLHVALQIAKGMEYLQSIKFIHRDLAARNCLVSDGLTVKISDFGLSKELNEKNYYQLHSKGKLPIRVMWMLF